MANTFKVVTFAAEPASAGTAYKMYTVAGSTTTVVLGLILTNIHSSAVTAEVELATLALAMRTPERPPRVADWLSMLVLRETGSVQLEAGAVPTPRGD